MNEKGKKNILIAILVLLTIGLSVAYSALATSLNIAGTGHVDGNWDIHFDIDSLSRLDNNTEINPDIELDVATFKLNVDLEKPGDMVSYSFDVVNEGTIDAKVFSIVLPDIAAYESYHLYYELVYYKENGEEIQLTSQMTKEQIQTELEKIKEDILAKGTLVNGQVQISEEGRRRLKISVQYKDITIDEFDNQAPDIPLQLETTILYVQV